MRRLVAAVVWGLKHINGREKVKRSSSVYCLAYDHKVAPVPLALMKIKMSLMTCVFLMVF